MKKLTNKKILLVVGIVMILVGAGSLIRKACYPNIVTELAPVREAGETAIAALNAVAKSNDKDSALRVAIEALPIEGDAHGKTLEERVAFWVGSDFDQIDSMKFKLLSGAEISANDAAGKVSKGYTRNQVVVEIFSNGKKEEYFLQCANGLVERRNENLISETAIGNTRTVQHSDRVIVIPPGGSLCASLEVTKQEALTIAQGNGLLHWEKGKKLYAMVHPGDRFAIGYDGQWTKLYSGVESK